MNATEFPPANHSFGDPATELLVSISNPTIGGTPLRITIDKRLCAVRFENETEDRVTIVIEAAA